MSKLIPKFYGEVVKGRLVFSDPTSLSIYLRYFKEGTEVEVVIKRRTKKRSNQQNRYYFGVIIKMLSEHFGYNKKDMNACLSLQFLKVYPENKLPYIRSTTELTTKEFEIYIEDIKIWAMIDWGVDIPDVNANIVWE